MLCSSFACPWYFRAYPNGGRAFLVVGCASGCDRVKCAVWAASGNGTRLIPSMEAALKRNAISSDWLRRLLAKARESPGELLHPFELELATLRYDDGLDPFYYFLWTTMFRDRRLPTDAELRDEQCVTFIPAVSLLYRASLSTTYTFACVFVGDGAGWQVWSRSSRLATRTVR